MMYKFVITIVFLASFLSFNQANAQLRIAPQLGINVSTFTESVFGNVENFYRSGLQVGAILDMPLVKSKNIYFRPGLIYSSKGDNFLVGSRDAETVLNFLEVPMMFNGMIPVGEKGFKFYVNAGPYVGFTLGGKVTIEDGDDVDLSIGSSDEDDYKAFDIGIRTAIGMEYKSFIFDIQTSYGFVDLNTSEDLGEFNHGLSFTIGYFFPVFEKK